MSNVNKQGTQNLYGKRAMQARGARNNTVNYNTHNDTIDN